MSYTQSSLTAYARRIISIIILVQYGALFSSDYSLNSTLDKAVKCGIELYQSTLQTTSYKMLNTNKVFNVKITNNQDNLSVTLTEGTIKNQDNDGKELITGITLEKQYQFLNSFHSSLAGLYLDIAQTNCVKAFSYTATPDKYAVVFFNRLKDVPDYNAQLMIKKIPSLNNTKEITNNNSNDDIHNNDK